MFEFRYGLYIQGFDLFKTDGYTDIGKYPSHFVPTLCRIGVPKACMTLVGDLDRMDFFFAILVLHARRPNY